MSSVVSDQSAPEDRRVSPRKAPAARDGCPHISAAVAQAQIRQGFGVVERAAVCDMRPRRHRQRLDKFCRPRRRRYHGLRDVAEAQTKQQLVPCRRVFPCGGSSAQAPVMLRPAKSIRLFCRKQLVSRSIDQRQPPRDRFHDATLALGRTLRSPDSPSTRYRGRPLRLARLWRCGRQSCVAHTRLHPRRRCASFPAATSQNEPVSQSPSGVICSGRAVSIHAARRVQGLLPLGRQFRPRLLRMLRKHCRPPPLPCGRRQAPPNHLCVSDHSCGAAFLSAKMRDVAVGPSFASSNPNSR